ncbi:MULTISPECIES: accessory factor UbiK family protein [Gammaproteobacteria]|jgi:BMFP domain-containing protein YqiC|uniref:Ubiquinone biosynthesis accessory factor UbiK n=1 Tax=Vreelandella halophila TaxID=86177 RepID=A0A9X5B572_9GAMM|nr:MULTISPECIES: accessory factor UbiK family protein [Gammaproteobacteria]KAA8981224.1 accessory factor UbiK family protein [Halospina sp. K52047b]MYL26234.1 accessory factor UbiK family protein [Halomonas utahensis]MYL73204.1 accessory factor UbiK family protein [Halomonas sp. 22501_18_FS]
MPRSPQDLFSELRGQLDQFMPDMARVARDDVEQHVRMAVTSVLDRLDLVTREEFDAQSAVLTRTREKVEALEKRVAALEEQLGRDQQ